MHIERIYGSGSRVTSASIAARGVVPTSPAGAGAPLVPTHTTHTTHSHCTSPAAARDIQKWEYVPLGPFGAKNFCTTVSPWIITLEALEPFRCPTSTGAQTDPVPLPYLRDPKYGAYDIALEVTIAPEDASVPPTVVSRSNFRFMYWSQAQQLAHHTVTGCNMCPGDLLGSGTISGPVREAWGGSNHLAVGARESDT